MQLTGITLPEPPSKLLLFFIVSTDSPLQQSPLRAEHLQQGGKLVPFAGWELPVQYEGILPEHQAVRNRVGLFDISHMGQFFVRSTKIEQVLDKVFTNRFSDLKEGEGHYTLLLNDQGGVVDDLILYRTAEDEALLVVNAAKIAEDWQYLSQLIGDEVELENTSQDYAAMAVQGPQAKEVFAAFQEGELPERNQVKVLSQGGFVCRTGYTGEDGYELFVPVVDGPSWWRKCIDQGVTPCGLGARDSLRLEACYPLNGNDLDPQHTPLQAGLGFAVKLTEEREFPGAEVLRKQKEEGLGQRLVALQVTGKGAPPRPGYPVMDADVQIGVLSSGGFGPTVGAGIGLAYLPVAKAKVGTKLELEVRNRRVPVKVVKKPFYSGL